MYSGAPGKGPEAAYNPMANANARARGIQFELGHAGSAVAETGYVVLLATESRPFRTAAPQAVGRAEPAGRPVAEARLEGSSTKQSFIDARHPRTSAIVTSASNRLSGRAVNLTRS
ncbi:hypothetical protein BX281_10496 [Streptomyces sp. Ag82_O1-15]|uniref:hypothetical protein n=1 Tax=Streptomyces sp. Ag82_O1-15 TaxID=1938855 RepID=UPI000BCB2116|nr:hypothetical protein [Streptomyces sp. Ag82_O1-15]PBD02251.1 hypothetical protein BX281_10496 [Streptomyces sp. Ag82_O1-15]